MVEPARLALAEVQTPVRISSPELVTAALPAAETPVTFRAPEFARARSPPLAPLNTATSFAPVRIVDPVELVVREAGWIAPDSPMAPVLQMLAFPDVAMPATFRLPV